MGQQILTYPVRMKNPDRWVVGESACVIQSHCQIREDLSFLVAAIFSKSGLIQKLKFSYILIIFFCGQLCYK